MNRLTMIGMLAGGLLIGVLPPAVANATSAPDPGQKGDISSHFFHDMPPAEYERCVEGSVDPQGCSNYGYSSSDMEQMQQNLGRLSRLNAMSSAVVSQEQASVSQMAKNVKQ